MDRRAEILVVAAVVIVAIAAIAGALWLEKGAQTESTKSAARRSPATESPTPAATTPTAVPTAVPTPFPVPDVPTPKPTPYASVIIVSAQDGSVDAQAVPGSSCRLTISLSDGSPYKPPGSERVMVADRAGHVRWQYNTGPTTAAGNQTVTCTISGLTATATRSFQGGS